jgi:hypothetical protein
VVQRGGVGEVRAFEDVGYSKDGGGELLVLDGTFLDDMDLSIAGYVEENLDITTLQPILTTWGWVESRRSAAPGSHETRCNGA